MTRIIILLAISTLFFSCEELLNTSSNDNKQPQTEVVTPPNNQTKGSDMPARKNFSEKDLQYQGQSINLTRHGRCRMECRKLDAYEVQEVINQGKINQRKSNPNSKPCPSIAFEGKTSDGQSARIVLGTCEGNYKIITAIDLENEWKCDCK